MAHDFNCFELFATLIHRFRDEEEGCDQKRNKNQGADSEGILDTQPLDDNARDDLAAGTLASCNLIDSLRQTLGGLRMST